MPVDTLKQQADTARTSIQTQAISSRSDIKTSAQKYRDQLAIPESKPGEIPSKPVSKSGIPPGVQPSVGISTDSSLVRINNWEREQLQNINQAEVNALAELRSQITEGYSGMRDFLTSNIQIAGDKYIPKTDFEKLSPEEQEIVSSGGLNALETKWEKDRQDFLAKHVAIAGDQYITKEDFKKLSTEEQTIIKQSGLGALTQHLEYLGEKQTADFLKKNVGIARDQYIAKEDWIQLSPKEQSILKAEGLEALQSYHTGQQAEFDRNYIKIAGDQFIQRQDYDTLSQEEKNVVQSEGLQGLKRLNEQKAADFTSKYIEIGGGQVMARTDFGTLSTEEQKVVKAGGFAQLEKYWSAQDRGKSRKERQELTEWTRDNVQIAGDNQWVSKGAFYSLSPKYQQILQTQGETALNIAIAQDEAMQLQVQDGIQLQGGGQVSKLTIENMSSADFERLNTLGLTEYNKWVEANNLETTRWTEANRVVSPEALSQELGIPLAMAQEMVNTAEGQIIIPKERLESLPTQYYTGGTTQIASTPKSVMVGGIVIPGSTLGTLHAEAAGQLNERWAWLQDYKGEESDTYDLAAALSDKSPSAITPSDLRALGFSQEDISLAESISAANALPQAKEHALWEYFVPGYGTKITADERGWTSGWTIASLIGDIALVGGLAGAAVRGATVGVTGVSRATALGTTARTVTAGTVKAPFKFASSAVQSPFKLVGGVVKTARHPGSASLGGLGKSAGELIDVSTYAYRHPVETAKGLKGLTTGSQYIGKLPTSTAITKGPAAYGYIETSPGVVEWAPKGYTQTTSTVRTLTTKPIKSGTFKGGKWEIRRPTIESVTTTSKPPMVVSDELKRFPTVSTDTMPRGSLLEAPPWEVHGVPKLTTTSEIIPELSTRGPGKLVQLGEARWIPGKKGFVAGENIPFESKVTSKVVPDTAGYVDELVQTPQGWVTRTKWDPGTTVVGSERTEYLVPSMKSISQYPTTEVTRGDLLKRVKHPATYRQDTPAPMPGQDYPLSGRPKPAIPGYNLGLPETAGAKYTIPSGEALYPTPFGMQTGYGKPSWNIIKPSWEEGGIVLGGQGPGTITSPPGVRVFGGGGSAVAPSTRTMSIGALHKEIESRGGVIPLIGVPEPGTTRPFFIPGITPLPEGEEVSPYVPTVIPVVPDMPTPGIVSPISPSVPEILPTTTPSVTPEVTPEEFPGIEPGAEPYVEPSPGATPGADPGVFPGVGPSAVPATFPGTEPGLKGIQAVSPLVKPRVGLGTDPGTGISVSPDIFTSPQPELLPETLPSSKLVVPVKTKLGTTEPDPYKPPPKEEEPKKKVGPFVPWFGLGDEEEDISKEEIPGIQVGPVSGMLPSLYVHLPGTLEPVDRPLTPRPILHRTQKRIVKEREVPASSFRPIR